LKVRTLFEIWLDHYRANRAAGKRAAIDRITVLLKEREVLFAQSAISSGELVTAARYRGSLR
jgi:hypothetical protein